MKSSPCCNRLWVSHHSTVVLINSGASHLFVIEFMVKLHYWFIESTELTSIHFDTGCEVVLDLMYIVTIVLCGIGWYAIA